MLDTVLRHSDRTRAAFAFAALSLACAPALATERAWGDDAASRCDAPAGAIESSPPSFEASGSFSSAEPASILGYELRNGIAGRTAAFGGPTAQFDVRGSAPTGTPERGTVFNYDFVWQRPSEFDRGHAGAAVQFGTSGDGLKTRHTMVHPAVADAQWTRLDSWVQLNEPHSDRVVRVGDAVTRPGATGRARRFCRRAMGHRSRRRRRVRCTLPVAGPAVVARLGDVPRTLDVLISQAHDRVVPVDAGPDQLRRLPAVFGNGDVQLVTTDLLGRAQWSSVPLFVVARTAAGRHDQLQRIARARAPLLRPRLRRLRRPASAGVLAPGPHAGADRRTAPRRGRRQQRARGFGE